MFTQRRTLQLFTTKEKLLGNYFAVKRSEGKSNLDLLEKKSKGNENSEKLIWRKFKFTILFFIFLQEDLLLSMPSFG